MGGFPTRIVAGPEGKVVARPPGFVTAPQLAELLRRAPAAKPALPTSGGRGRTAVSPSEVWTNAGPSLFFAPSTFRHFDSVRVGYSSDLVTAAATRSDRARGTLLAATALAESLAPTLERAAGLAAQSDASVAVAQVMLAYIDAHPAATAGNAGTGRTGTTSGTATGANNLSGMDANALANLSGVNGTPTNTNATSTRPTGTATPGTPSTGAATTTGATTSTGGTTTGSGPTTTGTGAGNGNTAGTVSNTGATSGLSSLTP